MISTIVLNYEFRALGEDEFGGSGNAISANSPLTKSSSFALAPTSTKVGLSLLSSA